MTKERLLEIFDSPGGGKYLTTISSNVFHGLMELRQYISDADISGAEHDIVYICDIDQALEAGLDEDSAFLLHYLNWHIDDDCFCCFV